jgi:hypothetical protein
LRPAAETFPWKKYPFTEAINAYARGIGAAKSGDAVAARAQADRLQTLRGAMKVAYWVEEMAIQTEVVRGLASCAEGNRPACISTLRAAATREDATEKHVVTPGPILPARELLADTYFAIEKPREALREYEAVLVKEPNRYRAIAGAMQAADRAGDREKAKRFAAELTKQAAAADAARPSLTQARQLASAQ